MSAPDNKKALKEGLADALGFVLGALAGWQLGLQFGLDFVGNQSWGPRELAGLALILIGAGAARWLMRRLLLGRGGRP